MSEPKPKRPRGRPRLLDKSAKRRMIYLTDAELVAVREFIKQLRRKPS